MRINIMKDSTRSLIINVLESEIKSSKKAVWIDKMVKAHKSIPNISEATLTDAFSKAYDDAAGVSVKKPVSG